VDEIEEMKKKIRILLDLVQSQEEALRVLSLPKEK
jgi:hypothetical protein